MAQRTIIITGCSSGIGYDAARTLTNRGWRVFATCRKQEDCDRLCSEGFDSFVLDYTRAETFDTALQRVWDQTDGHLDALFNNGAFGNPCFVEDLPTDALREMFEANLFGWHELTRRVVPAMRNAGGGRIVMNSSGLGIVPYRYRGAYVATKFALEGLTDVLRLELHGSGIFVSLIEPGLIETKFREKSIPHFERWVDWENSARREEYEKTVIPRLYGRTGGKSHAGPEAVTRKLIHALESPRPAPRYYVTPLVWIAVFLRRVLPTRAQDWIQLRV